MLKCVYLKRHTRQLVTNRHVGIGGTSQTHFMHLRIERSAASLSLSPMRIVRLPNLHSISETRIPHFLFLLSYYIRSM